MGILTGRDEGIKLIAHADYAFIGPLSDYSKGLFLSYVTISIDNIHRYVNAIITTNRSLYP